MVISEKIFEAFLKCKTKAYLLYFADPRRVSPFDSISEWQRKIRENASETYIKHILSGDLGIFLIGDKNFDQTKTQGYRWIVNPKISDDNLVCSPPLLENVSFSSKNNTNPIWVPVRIFPSERFNNDQKQLLAFDALLLGKISGHFPDTGKIIYGKKQAISSIKLSKLICKVDAALENLCATLENNSSPNFSLIRHCPECEFESLCKDRAVKDDDLSLLGVIPQKEIAKLKKKGIFTITQLSYTFRLRRRKVKGGVSHVGKYQYALKALAIRENKTYIVGTIDLTLDRTPVYLDVEGIPEQSFYYLIGVRAVLDEIVIKKSFWANDQHEEGRMWYDFLHFLASLENPVLFYYGKYETTFLKVMKIRYGDSLSSGFSISRLADEAVNVLKIIYSHIYFPTYSNGLKDIAGHLGFKWSTVCTSGLRSIILRNDWEMTNEVSIKNELVLYNQDDCEALDVVVTAIKKIASQNSFEVNSQEHLDTIKVETLKNASRPYSYGRKEFAFSDLAYITKCAYWDYQRDKVYIRTKNNIKPKKEKSVKNTASRLVPINKVISPTRPEKCQNCGSDKFFLNGRHDRKLYDLRFMAGGIKRWVTRQIIDHYKCKECSSTFVSEMAQKKRYHYGHQLFSYVIYSLIELHITQYQLTKIIKKTFGLPLSQTTIMNIKHRAAEFYRETAQEIRSDLLSGSLIHADETRVSVEGFDSYVWVFTSMKEVIYIWADTREAQTATDLLKNFKGVLVSDFYSAYDSIDCPQQKCLVHLIRDLNEEVLNDPFNQEIKNFVQEFAVLVRNIVDTIDKFGLKKHYLKKHIADVVRFYEKTVAQKYETTSAQKLQSRFKKNENKLFKFLEFDDIPWNNNNAEHAVKAFGRGIRDNIDGRSSKDGIADYLTLLSIYQTCEYRGIDFLEFLRSGETHLGGYSRPAHK